MDLGDTVQSIAQSKVVKVNGKSSDRRPRGAWWNSGDCLRHVLFTGVKDLSFGPAGSGTVSSGPRTEQNQGALASALETRSSLSSDFVEFGGGHFLAKVQ